ncbi:MAG: type II toxin-antitoxin system death-on-curing family toxin [marine benthic group bacterium]|nr:type II toxin-antitoxin system death-on-curing family toxin [Candidatus Benthicola marisminoris]
MPNEAVQFLTADEVLAIHERLIAVFGGKTGLRDRGLLESALHRPQTGYYPDLAEMAAALFESLIINHPFMDGEKRVAFFAADVFLRLNGWKLEVDDEEAHTFLTERLETGTCDFGYLLPWIRRHLTRYEFL